MEINKEKLIEYLKSLEMVVDNQIDNEDLPYSDELIEHIGYRRALDDVFGYLRENE